MKKNFKFLLVAMLAFFGFNSAMAAELVNSTQYDTNGFQYVIKSMTKTDGVWTGTVEMKQNTFSGTSITINPTVNITVEGEVGGVACKGVVTFDIVRIADNGFKGLSSVTSITFAEGCKITEIGAGAFEGTKIADLDLTKTKITKLEKLFEDANTTLKTVKLPATLTETADYALQHCYALNSIDLTLCTKLLTLGANCFGDNVVETLDMSKTIVKTLASHPFVGATGESGEKNKTLKKLVLPATINVAETGLANLYNLEEVNLEDTKITAVSANAFENDKALTSLTFPNTLKYLRKGDAFKGCLSLATLNIPYDALLEVGGDTNPLFTEATAGDGSLSALKTLNFFSNAKTKPTFKAAIKTTSFENCTGITTVNIAVGDEIAAAATLTAASIALSTTENSTVTMGKISNVPGAGFIVGPTADGVEANVTFGEINAAQNQDAAIVSGNLGTVTVGKLSAALQIEAIGLASKIVFNGEITTALTAATTRVPNTRLTAIDFGKIKIANTANIIPAEAFDQNNAPNLTAVSWIPANANIPTALVFNQTAFQTASVDALAKVTFTTVPKVAALYPNNVDTPTIVDDDLYNVVFDFAGANAAIKVYGPASGNAFIGYFYADGYNYEIAKSQNGATITVYSAFIDESDYKLYMDPLQIVDGKFVVENGETVVIRSTKSDDVTALVTKKTNTMRYDKGGNLINDLMFTADAISADELGTQYYDKGQYVYYLTNPSSTGTIAFNILKSTYFLPENSVYTVRNGQAAAGRLTIVWLDEANNATAIEKIQKAAQEDVIYNLAGQKVDANFKGIVIKNGKKMIQK